MHLIVHWNQYWGQRIYSKERESKVNSRIIMTNKFKKNSNLFLVQVTFNKKIKQSIVNLIPIANLKMSLIQYSAPLIKKKKVTRVNLQIVNPMNQRKNWSMSLPQVMSQNHVRVHLSLPNKFKCKMILIQCRRKMRLMILIGRRVISNIMINNQMKVVMVEIVSRKDRIKIKAHKIKMIIKLII